MRRILPVIIALGLLFTVSQAQYTPSGGGASVAKTTNMLAGDGSGNAVSAGFAAGVVVKTSDTGSVSNGMLAGSIGNSKLANSTMTVGNVTCTLGSSCAPTVPHGPGATFTGAGSALTSGTTAGSSLVYLPPLPYACTASAWTVTVDTGTAGFRVWQVAAGTAVPTVANTITTADLAISTGTNLRSTTFTNFTGGVAPVFAANDIIAIQLNAASSATFAAFSIQCQ